MTFREEVKQHLAVIKRDNCCRLCGEGHPACLDFHHTDPEGKEFAIADFMKRRQPRFADLLIELKKCELICSNCHRRLHWKE